MPVWTVASGFGIKSIYALTTLKNSFPSRTILPFPDVIKNHLSEIFSPKIFIPAGRRSSKFQVPSSKFNRTLFSNDPEYPSAHTNHFILTPACGWSSVFRVPSSESYIPALLCYANELLACFNHSAVSRNVEFRILNLLILNLYGTC